MTTPTSTDPRVHVVGTGLIGTSLGLALTRAGWPVTLEDISSTNAALARDLGAGSTTPTSTAPPGQRGEGDGPAAHPDLVVVATPPDVTAGCVADALDRWPQAAVTDVASVKATVIDDLRARGADLTRFCGSHPMAGRERSGAVAGRHDLFHGRAWVLTPTEETGEQARELVAHVARTVGAEVIVLPPGDHDAAVASVSHVPQLMASLVAARLEDLDGSAVALSGQGLRDVTRIAASDPHLWTQILSGNATAVRDVLRAIASDLDGVIAALDALDADSDAPGARGTLARAIAAGNAGHARIPGKHGAAPTAYETVRVLIPDEPGQLGRLFADVGEIGTNIEEFHLDHGLGQAFGLAEVDVVPAAAAELAEGLQARGWRLHG
ncbi:prephenate dehydrogenase [Knoellia remsis]|uniref:Prephenate dehydrogenase n=1 Tax=Knoellia remsis TaxID=407159 RepID=A0A2T0UFE8_9MICO|nr:prephenate dehydrogenase [Knoellia remsis]PRY56632.1 prephenate dehydrogenase [Knoellia remsis]